MDRSRHLYTSAGFGALVLWSSTVAVGRSIAHQLGPLTAATLAFALAGAGAWLIHSLSTRAPGAHRRVQPLQWLLRGLLFAAYQACLYLALGWATSHAQAIELGLVNYLWPALTVVGLVLILRVRARPWLWPAVAVATLGVLLAMTQGGSVSPLSFVRHALSNPAAYFLALLAAAAWALYSVLTRRWAAGADARSILDYLILTAIVLGVLRLGVVEQCHWSLRALVELLFLAIATPLAYILWDLAMRRGDIVLVTSASYLTPLLSTLISTLYLGVAAGPQLWVGAVLVVLGAVACRLALRSAADLKN